MLKVNISQKICPFCLLNHFSRNNEFRLYFIVYNSVDNLEVTGVSRSGRVRKKSSKLMDFRSPDDIDAARALKRAQLLKSPSTKQQHLLTHNTQSGLLSPTSTISSHHLPPTISNNTLNEIIHSSAVPTTIKLEPELLINSENDIEMLLPSDKFSPNDFGSDLNVQVDSNDNCSEDEFSIDTTVRKSAYMTEKSTKKKILKDGKIVLSRLQRKDKGKPRFTAYMLWAKEIRQEMLKSNPDLDFASTSRRLGEMWANVPSNEKYNWRRRAKRLAVRNKRVPKIGSKSSIVVTNAGESSPSQQTATTIFLNKSSVGRPGRKPKHFKNMQKNSLTKKLKIVRKSITTNGLKAEKNNTNITGSGGSIVKQKTITPNNKISPITPGAYKVIGVGPTDIAAHLKLLGDSLTIIGQRLKEHEVIFNINQKKRKKNIFSKITYFVLTSLDFRVKLLFLAVYLYYLTVYCVHWVH